MLWIQKGAVRSPVPNLVTFVRFVPQLAYKGKKGTIKKVEEYNIKERRALVKLETHAFVVAYWELLEEQYRHKTEEDALDEPSDKKSDVTDNTNPSQTSSSPQKRAYQKVNRTHIAPDLVNHKPGDTSTCGTISLTFDKEEGTAKEVPSHNPNSGNVRNYA